VRERALRFGTDKGLVGIVTEPRAVREGAPAVLFLNSGLVHRIGASRMHVHMARRLAPAGITSLRFDFAGIGDSEPRKDSVTFEEGAVQEVREAMDLLATTRGFERFILAGLCSGADMSYYTALVDARVIGIFQIDPFVYHTRRFMLGRYGPKLLKATSWKNLMSGRNVLGRKLRGIQTVTSTEAPTPDMIPPPYWREFPPQEQVEAGLRALVERNVRILNVFTAGHEMHYNYAGQYAEAFKTIDFRGVMRELFYPDADHILTGPAQQRRVVEALAQWVGELTSDTQAAAPSPIARTASSP
jgi:hypothetical protein